MKQLKQLTASLIVVITLLGFVNPCGPGYVSPVFEATDAPEVPFTDYASGRLGIVGQSFSRSLLIAAYRHIAGNGLTAGEQRAMLDIWNAEINRKDFVDNTVDESVKVWLAARKKVSKDEKPPEVYAERPYGGYDFFPNCTRNAFETASETLESRTTSYGESDQNVKNWVEAQDKVFENCSKGRSIPEPAPVGSPLWLQKDRDYQIAAAEFYSLGYKAAKTRFAEIAQDTESPWRETADYLVARTLIRQASLAPKTESAAPFYQEAEDHLAKFISTSGKFSESATRLTGLVKYRLRPKERVSELAKDITIYSGGANFRQDVIDYVWLLDKFEADALSAEEKRKESEKSPVPEQDRSAEPVRASNATNVNTSAERRSPEDLEIFLYSVSSGTSWRILVSPEADDEDAIAEAEKVVGKPLNDELRSQVKDGRKRAYQSRHADNARSGYQGGYWGEGRLTSSLLPDFLKRDEITEWLYLYQMSGQEAYLRSLKKFAETGSDVWLMAAFAQADASSAQLPRIFEAFDRTSRAGPGYATMAFHAARLRLSQGREGEARKLIDEMLGLGDTLPVSARNSFIGLRLKLAQTLDEFITFSLKKPFAFDFSGSVGTIDEIIAEQKTYYDPEYHKDGREAYEAGVDAQYKEEKLWSDRPTFDSSTIEVLNQHLSTAALLEFYRSPALPDYLRPRLAMAVWTRAFLLGDLATLNRFSAELSVRRPELKPLVDAISAAKSPAARENAYLDLVVRNPILSPFVEDGIGKTDNEVEEWGSNDWWCEPYDTEYDNQTNAEVSKRLPPKPPYLKEWQTRAAQQERKRIKALGDAPKFLGRKVLLWARSSPNDKRVPQALYTMIIANGWSKYGCGNNEELRSELAKLLRSRYPDDPWTKRLIEEDRERS